MSSSRLLKYRSLQARDSSRGQVQDTALLQTRATGSSDRCPQTPYTAPNGYVFDVHCKTNFPNEDIGDGPVPASDAEDCMNQCSIYHGEPPCGGVAYNTATGDCWMKNEEPTTSGLIGDSVTITMIARKGQLDPQDAACPFDDGSIQKSENGEPFVIKCATNLVNFDLCPSGNINTCPYHAESLQECMDLASTAPQFVNGVAYAPKMIDGFANCYPKSSNKTSLMDPATNPPVHMAIAIPSSLDGSCDDGTTTSSADDKYNISCSEDRKGNDLQDPSFTETLDDCVAKCSNVDSCVGVVWTWDYSNGYENCQMKSNTGVPSDSKGSTTALLSTVPSKNGTIKDATDSSTSSDSSSGGSSSKAWIAGPVIGGVVFVAIVAGLFFWYRARKNRKAAAAPGLERKTSRGPGGEYLDGRGVYHQTSQMPQQGYHQNGFYGRPSTPSAELPPNHLSPDSKEYYAKRSASPMQELHGAHIPADRAAVNSAPVELDGGFTAQELSPNEAGSVPSPAPPYSPSGQSRGSPGKSGSPV